MRLRSLRIERLPGLRPGFEIDGLDSGINVIVGPNASGKSSLLRAFRAILHAEECPGAAIHVEGSFEDSAGLLRAERLGRDLHWTRDGMPVEPPPLPEHRFICCYTLQLEDLLAAGEADAEIGKRIARELAGGYDLGAAAGAFSLKQTHGKVEAAARKEAQKRLGEKVREHEALRRDEGRLEELRRDREDAVKAMGEVEKVQSALEALEARQRRREFEEKLGGFPGGMDRLRGDELGRLFELGDKRRSAEEDGREAEEKLNKAIEAIHATGLEEAAPDEGMLGEVRRALDRLRRLEHELESLDNDRRDAEALLREAVSGLGGAPEAAPRLEPASLSRVEQALSAKRELEGEIRALEAEKRRLPENPSAARLDTLRAGRRELLAWLGAPRSPVNTALFRISLVVLVLILSAALSISVWRVHWALALLSLPAVASLVVLIRTGPRGNRRHESRARYEALGIEAPSAWDDAAAIQRLEGLDQELAEAEEGRLREKRRQEVVAEREDLGKKRQEEIDALGGIARQVGFDPLKLDASFERWLRLVQACDRAREKLAEIEARIAGKSEEAEKLREASLSFLKRFGEAPSERIDAMTLGDRLESLSNRLRALKEARKDRDAAMKAKERAAESLEETEGKTRQLYEQAGLPPGDVETLRRLMDELGPWKKAGSELLQAKGIESDRLRRLDRREDLIRQVDAENEDALKVILRDLREKAARQVELSEEIGSIEKMISQAQRGRGLEGARAERQRCEDALRGRLEEALQAEAGLFLLDEVRSEHESASQPGALRRAREWFGRFTRHQFDLLFEDGAGCGLGARETASGERRRLEELSSATRMQLLIAARLAFALEIERGREPLPFFLDEALTASDPERFQAAVEALRALAYEGGRQVFYLTAQPRDAAAWRREGPAPRVIDIGELRRISEGFAVAEDLEMPECVAPPDPAGQTPEEYATAIGVPPIDPWAEASAIHLFHLLRDDLPLLHRLLRHGIERAGPLGNLLDGSAREALLTAEEAGSLECRLAAASAWLAAWRRGRGRRLTRAAIADSPVSGTFRERAGELVDKLGGDARRLLEEIEKGALERFRKASIGELRDWLIDRGFLDERDPSTAIDRRLAALAAVRQRSGTGSLREEAITSLADSLEAGTRRSTGSR